TFYDTADTYGNGLGETILAKALKDHYKDIVIATKFGYDFYNTPPEARKGQEELPQDFSETFVRFALEQSLKRLETDHIPIYQIHNLKMTSAANDGLFALLEKFKKEGKIGIYGVALGP